MRKALLAVEEVLKRLSAAGLVEDGSTRTEHARVPTKDSPVFGQSGGQLATFGGRMCLAKEGTRIKATVGERTTAIYEVVGSGLAGVRGIAAVDTSDIEKIRAAVNAL